MADEFNYRAQDVDYLGFLETQLRDQQGIATLAYELVQNADDVRSGEGQGQTTSIVFDVRDDALVVENDGVFRPIDFARLQRIASGGKRDEAGTTGAFGLGFLAVYQITDAPEILSSGRHWIMHPEAPAGKRIREREVATSGTQFRLPWAFDPASPVRRRLRLPAVEAGDLDRYAAEIGRSLALAALFLRQLRVLEVRRLGETVRRIERFGGWNEREEVQELRLEDAGRTARWLLLQGSFVDEAEALRGRYPDQIETTRESIVRLALRLEGLLPQGRLFAGLPTEMLHPLPFHINADFYPTSDRRRIHLEGGYQATWNIVALTAAADVVISHWRELQAALGAVAWWQLLAQMERTHALATTGDLPAVLTVFWERATRLLGNAPIVYTAQGEWLPPGAARVLASDRSVATRTLLDELHIPTVHPDLAPYFTLMQQPEIGVAPLRIGDVTAALLEVGQTAEMPLFEAPPFLRAVATLQQLWHLLDRLLEDTESLEAYREARARLDPVAIVLTQQMALAPLDTVYAGTEEEQRLFPQVAWLHEMAPEDGFPRAYVPPFSARAAVERLKAMGTAALEAAWQRGQLDVPGLFRWFEAKQIEIFADDPALQAEIRRLPLCPVAGELRSLSTLYIPGGFEDPLHLTGLVDVDALGGRWQFLQDLGVNALTFERYLHDEMPRALEQFPDLPSDARHRLRRLLAERLGEFRDDNALQERLADLPLIPCMDGTFRAAREVYAQREAREILGEGTHIAEPVELESLRALHHWLGVRESASVQDLVKRLVALSSQVRTAEGSMRPALLTAMERVWEQLSAEAENTIPAQSTLEPLVANPVILDGAKQLRRVEEVLLNDAPEIASQFPDLAPQLLAPDDSLAAVYRRLGVRSLSETVQVTVAAAPGATNDDEVQALLHTRQSLIRRIVAAQAVEDAFAATAFIKRLKVREAATIDVRWRLEVGDGVYLSATQAVKATIDWQQEVLYLCRDEGQVPWAAVARELAVGIGGSRSAGALALAIRQVLVADSNSAARALLDELGYP